MRNLFGILIFLTASLLTQESSAVTYSCPNGGALSGTTCTVGSNYAATPNYSCPSGGALSGTTCTISGSYAGIAIPSSCSIIYDTCYSNCTYNYGGNGSATAACKTACKPSGSNPCTNQPLIAYSCPSGGVLSGTTCNTTSSYAALISYTCPSGGALSGTTCVNQSTYAATGTYPATPSYTCPSGGSLSGTACTISGNYTATATSYWLGNGIKWPSLAQCSNSCNGGRITCRNWCKTGMVYSCPSGGTLVGATCYTSSAYTATTNYSCSAGHTLSGTTCSFISAYTPPPLQCNPGDTLSGTTCTHIATANTTTHNLCVDADGNGVTDPFQSGSEFISPATCRPDLKTSTAQFLYNCMAESGDPTGAAWYLLTGTTHVQTVSQSQTLSAPICRYDPPIVDGAYSYSTFSCTSPNVLIGMSCQPPIQQLTPTKNTGYSCTTPDVLDGTTCTPSLKITPAVVNTSYTCPTATDYLSSITNQCIPLVQTAPTTTTIGFTCGNNARLNTTTNQCELFNIPAVAVAGNWTCPASYTLNGTWCLPNALSTYPAAWSLGAYSCPSGGTLGAIAGLCYK